LVQIKLLKLQESHIEKVRIWRNSEEISKYMFTDPVISPEEQKQWFKEIKKKETSKYWIINVDGIDVGLVSLYNIDMQNKRSFWAFYIADPSVRGKGVGSAIELNILRYVFTELKINKLCGETMPINDRGFKIHEQFGSQVEGVLREHIVKKGQFHDVVMLGIIKSDWEKEIKTKYEVPKITIEY